ncbi:MAG: preQ(1) synthase [Endomicrobia bacterium]|nr:preQ(1) synthase [Endomicrobiia bacterium]
MKKNMLNRIKKMQPIYDKISKDFLIKIDYEYVGEKILIEVETQEFSCICPWSKLPDYAKLIIRYVPNRLCVELKSLKYYIQSFRNVGMIHENVVNRIFDDLYEVIKPKLLEVILEFNIRGGLKTTVKKQKGKI